MVKRFSIAALAAALTISTFFSGTSLTAHAEELTQIQNPEEVDYGNYGADFSNEDIALLESMFDADYYALSNPDVLNIIKAQLGDSYTEEAAKALLFKHFSTCGLFEGRSLSANFNVMAFASAYADLKNAFGKDLLSYYKYAATHDLAAEGRTITTVEAAAKAGITVTSVTNESVAITPQLYFVCEKLGVKDLQTVKDYVKAVVPVNTNSQSQSSSSTNTSASTGSQTTTPATSESVSEDNKSETPSDTKEETTPSPQRTAVAPTVTSTINPVTVSGFAVDQYGSLLLSADKANELILANSVGNLVVDGTGIRIYKVSDKNGNYAYYSNSEASGDPVAVSENFDKDNINKEWYYEITHYAYYDAENSRLYPNSTDNVTYYNGEKSNSWSNSGGYTTNSSKTAEDYAGYTVTLGIVFVEQDGKEYELVGTVYTSSDGTASGSNYSAACVTPEDTTTTETTTQNTENSTDESQNNTENETQQNNENQSDSTADDTNNSNESGNNVDSPSPDGE